MDLQEQQHFDALARQDGTAVRWYRTAASQRRLQRRAERIVAACSAVPLRVLELGCGEGSFTKCVGDRLPPTTELVSMELSFELLRLAHAHAAAPRRWMMQGDAEQLPFADASFDAVIGNAILHHVSIEAIVPECLRVLKPGGRFLFAEPNLLNPAIFITKRVPFVKRLLHESPHETAFIRWSLQQQLERLGMRAVAIDPFDFLLPVMPQCCVSGVDWLGRGLERVSGIRELAISLFITGSKCAY